jgi:glutaminase
MLEGLVGRALDLAREDKLARVADYIPALARARPDAVGAAITLVDGTCFEAGESRAAFTLQSVSKALALPYVMDARGEEAVFSRVGKEPTGDPFNSIIRLEASKLGKPYNPMINAGAIVVSSLMPGSTGAERAAGFREYAARLFGVPECGFDEEVYRSESATANKNRSIAWFLKELGLIDGDVDEALDGYFRQCSTLVSARSLSRYGACLALDGLEPGSVAIASNAGNGARLMSVRAARVTKGLMASCGLYDGSGAFSVEAGLAAKSGVGGGILATARKRLGIGTYGPALDGHGNSAAGVSIVKGISEKLDLFSL